jgi:hypothetical protein
LNNLFIVNCLGQEQLKWLWVPTITELPSLLDWTHQQTGHGRRDVMLRMLGEQYWWSNMRTPIEKFLAACTQCEDWRPSKAIAPPMPIVAKTRTERVIFDYSFVKLPDGRERWMLLFIILLRNLSGNVPSSMPILQMWYGL